MPQKTISNKQQPRSKNSRTTDHSTTLHVSWLHRPWDNTLLLVDHFSDCFLHKSLLIIFVVSHRSIWKYLTAMSMPLFMYSFINPAGPPELSSHFASHYFNFGTRLFLTIVGSLVPTTLHLNQNSSYCTFTYTYIIYNLQHVKYEEREWLLFQTKMMNDNDAIITGI